jgi:hypothetical protein
LVEVLVSESLEVAVAVVMVMLTLDAKDLVLLVVLAVEEH